MKGGEWGGHLPSREDTNSVGREKEGSMGSALWRLSNFDNLIATIIIMPIIGLVI